MMSKANQQFSKLNKLELDDSRRQELQWYYGLSLFLSNDAEATTILKKITPTQWKYKEAQELIKQPK